MSTAITNLGQNFLGTGSLAQDQFERWGHPGKWHACHQVLSGSTTVFTGSKFGAGALVVPSGTTGTVFLSSTGSISLTHLVSTEVQELSIHSVNVTAGGPVYVLIRNHGVRS